MMLKDDVAVAVVCCFFCPECIDCKSFGKINFLSEQNKYTWGWTLAKNQKHRILGSQNSLLHIKKV